MRDKRITITGGKGFLGAHLISKLKEKEYKYLFIADKPEYDLVDPKDIKRMYEDLKPDLLFTMQQRSEASAITGKIPLPFHAMFRNAQKRFIAPSMARKLALYTDC